MGGGVSIAAALTASSAAALAAALVAAPFARPSPVTPLRSLAATTITPLTTLLDPPAKHFHHDQTRARQRRFGKHLASPWSTIATSATLAGVRTTQFLFFYNNVTIVVILKRVETTA